jgi:hypothetical protein
MLLFKKDQVYKLNFGERAPFFREGDTITQDNGQMLLHLGKDYYILHKYRKIRNEKNQF